MNPKQIRVGLLSLLALFAMALDVSAQKRTVSGHVTDTEGVPMVGVGILVKGEGRGVISGQDGSWSISVSPENVLEFSLLGFQTQEITVGDRTVIDVRLELKANELDDVTVVAFAKQKKESIIASVSAVNPKELKIPSSNLTTALAGRVSGVISYQVSGEPGQDNAQFFVRGISSFGASAKKDPLILIDNIEMSSSDLARLTTDDIASFSVMKDATAAALYGARGANGVILITTKSGMEGKAKLNFRYETSISQPTREVEFADPVTYMSLHNEAVKTRNPIAPAPYSQEKIANTRLADRNTNVFPATDWYDMLFKPATVNQRFNFNLSGGGQISNYYISGAYTRDNGVLKSDSNNNFTNNINLNKYVLRANFNVNVTKSTKVTIRLHGAFDDYQGPLQGGSELYEMAMNANPVAFPAFYRTDDGILEPRKHTMFGTNDDNTYVNPYAEMVKGFKQYSSSTMLAQVEVRQDFSELITKGLSGRVLVNTDRYSYFDVRRESKPYFILWPHMTGTTVSIPSVPSTKAATPCLTRKERRMSILPSTWRRPLTMPVNSRTGTMLQDFWSTQCNSAFTATPAHFKNLSLTGIWDWPAVLPTTMTAATSWRRTLATTVRSASTPSIAGGSSLRPVWATSSPMRNSGSLSRTRSLCLNSRPHTVLSEMTP